MTASYTRVHIKRISWSNTDVVDYKVTSKVPVTSTPKLRALLPLYYSKTVAVGPRPVTFHQRGTVSAPQCWIDEYSNLRKKTFRHKRVLHSAGCLFQNTVICDTEGPLLATHCLRIRSQYITQETASNVADILKMPPALCILFTLRSRVFEEHGHLRSIQ